MSRDNNDWVAALREQQDVAIDDLRIRLLGNLRKALYSRNGVDDAFIEDAVQDSLLRILDKLDQFNGNSRFETWATSIAINVAMAELRRSRWKDVSLDDVLDGTTVVRMADNAQDSTPDDHFERKAVYGAMQQIIEMDLTEKQRTVLQAELRGMPQEQIARQLGSNRNAVYKLTHDARKKLKRGLESAGYTQDVVAAAIAD